MSTSSIECSLVSNLAEVLQIFYVSTLNTCLGFFLVAVFLDSRYEILLIAVILSWSSS